MRDLIVVADTHLSRRDPETEAFVEFLLRRGSEAAAVAHLGDLFNIWLGLPRFEMDHMGPVLAAFRALRGWGVRTILAEGNRDFHVRQGYEGDAFDEVAETEVELSVGARRVRLAHGDLVNVADRPYRLWRRLSRSAPVWAGVGLLPSRAGIRFAERLESKLRGTNVRHKSSFPEAAARDYAARAFTDGCSLLLVGHFHEQRVIRAGAGKEMVVLPDWRSSHRYLHVAADGAWSLDEWQTA